MAPARLLGALLLARAARELGALRPLDDAAGAEAPALEREEWPRRRARREAGQLFDRTPSTAWGADDSLHGAGQGSETDDDLDLHDGLPPAAGCYMRMSSGCPKQPLRTQAWRRDKMATERGLDEAGCHQRKQVWERYCGSDDAEMLYVSGKARSGLASALQVDVSALQIGAVWWPWGKKHGSTKHESTNDEKVQAVPLGEGESTKHESTIEEKVQAVPLGEVEGAKHESANDEKVQAVPLGEVVITHAGSFKGEYLYATQENDSYGGRFVHTRRNGSTQEDPQARWNISKVGGNYVITHAGSFKDEYLFATGHFVHTWKKGSLQEDPQARWNISKVGGAFVITHADSFQDEYLCAAENGDSSGLRVVHTSVKGGLPADDPQALWTITPVAKEKASSANSQQNVASVVSDVPVGYPSEPGCYMLMASGCPKRPMNTHTWRHDSWAEEHKLDRTGCEERKRVWDNFCEADDAKVFFVPGPPKQ